MIQPYEITIGSLLRTSKGEIIRVESISTKRQHRKVGYHAQDDPCRIKYVRLAQCEGIELTPEILEKNGYVHDEIYDRFISIDFDLYEDEAGFCSFFDGVEIRLDYVHQLQHALRLCGLNELADNFKL